MRLRFTSHYGHWESKSPSPPCISVGLMGTLCNGIPPSASSTTGCFHLTPLTMLYFHQSTLLPSACLATLPGTRGRGLGRCCSLLLPHCHHHCCPIEIPGLPHMSLELILLTVTKNTAETKFSHFTEANGAKLAISICHP